MNGIEHGTMRGWRQHKRRSIPACDLCADARRVDKEHQASEATQRARQAWNSWLVGTSRPATVTPVIERCTVAGCGTATDQPQPNAAMVRVDAPSVMEPARWYCPGRCAAIGRALVDLRSAS
ncbi:hypothetical protein ACWD5Q_06695 [Streptomyces sp. NPDC002513]